MGKTSTCAGQPVGADLQEDASDATEQLHPLLGLVLDDGVIRLHGQYVVLRDGQMNVERRERRRKERERSSNISTFGGPR